MKHFFQTVLLLTCCTASAHVPRDGQNGTGGFDAFIPGPELFCPTLGDAFGNLHAVYDQTHGSLTWYLSD